MSLFDEFKIKHDSMMNSLHRSTISRDGSRDFIRPDTSGKLYLHLNSTYYYISVEDAIWLKYALKKLLE